MKLATCLAVMIVSSAGAYSASSAAQSAPGGIHSSVANAAARCQGNLPVSDTSLRKRPLAVQNEGATAAFVTCGFEVDAYASDAGVSALDVNFANSSAAPISVTCTAVSGFANGTNEFVSKAVSIPANTTEQTDLFWEASEFSQGLFEGLVSISCNLPPGGAVNDSYAIWSEGMTAP